MYVQAKPRTMGNEVFQVRDVRKNRTPAFFKRQVSTLLLCRLQPKEPREDSTIQAQLVCQKRRESMGKDSTRAKELRRLARADFETRQLHLPALRQQAAIDRSPPRQTRATRSAHSEKQLPQKPRNSLPRVSPEGTPPRIMGSQSQKQFSQTFRVAIQN